MAETTRRAAGRKAAETADGQPEPETQEQAERQAQEVADAAAPESAADQNTPSMNLPPAGFVADEAPADGKTLTASTYLRNPGTGDVELLEAGTEPPPWALESDDEGNPLLGEHMFAEQTFGRDPSVAVPVDGAKPPAPDAPRGRWAAYASAHGIVIGPDASVLEMRDALDAAGVPIE